MSSPPHFSKHLHELFIQRFKGRMNSIGKEGQTGLVTQTCIPVDKMPRKSTDGYSSPLNHEILTPLIKVMPNFIASETEKSRVPKHQRFKSTPDVCFSPKSINNRASFQPTPTLEGFGSITEDKTNSGLTIKRSSKVHEIIQNEFNSPTRRQSLPRSFRSAKKEFTGKLIVADVSKPTKGKVEVLARTNFQKIGYMSLSISDANQFYRQTPSFNTKIKKDKPDIIQYDLGHQHYH